MPNQIRYPQVSVQQLMKLFNVWDISGDVEQACQTAQVSRATFYYWKDRFVSGGYRALENDTHRSAEPPTPVSALLADEILALKQGHPNWGRGQIMHALRTTHPFDHTINMETIGRVLLDAGFWY